MEIKPTTSSTQILTRVMNNRPSAFAYITGDHLSGTICFYRYREGSIMIYEMNGLFQKDQLFHMCIGEHLVLPDIYAKKGKAWGIIYLDDVKSRELLNQHIYLFDHQLQIAEGELKYFC